MGQYVIDIHIHLACLGDGGKGGKLSAKMRYSLPFLAMLCMHRLTPWSVDDHQLRTRVIAAIEGATQLDFGVVLALDAVHDASGRPAMAQTHLYTPNETVCELSRQCHKILFGASVHPNRPDALELLAKWKEAGAVLLKWLPSAQKIDPAEPRYRKFYQKLAELKLPLLCHTSVEHVVPSHGYQFCNDPQRLELALSEGVTVIAAHSCVPSIAFDHDYFPQFAALLQRAETRGWNLFADLSAMCLPGRLRQVARVKAAIPAHRMVLGSDFPVPMFPTSSRYIPAYQTLPENPLDRNLEVLRRMGFPETAFTRASAILPLPQWKINAGCV